MSTSSSRDRTVKRSCTDPVLDDDNEIIERMSTLYAAPLKRILEDARSHIEDPRRRAHNEMKVAWLAKTRWADVFAVPSNFNATSPLPLDVDLYCMDWKTFQQRADAGDIFRRPIIIKQTFQDSDMPEYEPQAYRQLLRERFPDQDLDIHDGETGECRSWVMGKNWDTNTDAACLDPKKLPTSGNAINLQKIANADAPLFTRMKRFRLLETLVDRASCLAPGKQTYHKPNDISDSLGFDTYGSGGVISGPHVDALIGTWVRCLSGSKAWIFTPGMDDRDWRDFAKHGVHWKPADKGRLTVLQKDDVLLMPPGLRALHTVFTIESSVMEGGMLWDELNIPAVLDGLFWVAEHQSCTNEAIPHQLPSVIDALQMWIQEHGARLTAATRDSGYVAAVEKGIQRLHSLGCKCIRGCHKSDNCACHQEGRRCTAWCSQHPTTSDEPVKRRNLACMFEQ